MAEVGVGRFLRMIFQLNLAVALLIGCYITLYCHAIAPQGCSSVYQISSCSKCPEESTLLAAAGIRALADASQSFTKTCTN